MKKKLVVFSGFFILFIAVLLSCSHRPEKGSFFSDGSADFNPADVSWFAVPRSPIVSSDDGLYYIMESYLYYADLKTYKSYPLCFKVGCSHENENYRTDCDAYVGSDPKYPGGMMFLGAYKGKLYVSVENISEKCLQLIEMEPDGSARKVVIDDMSSMDADSLMFHRGYLYFTSNEQRKNGESFQQIRRVSLDKISGTSEVLVEIRRSERHFYSFLPFLPLKDSLYYTEQNNDESIRVDLFRYDLTDKKEECIAESELFWIYGGVGDHVILRGAGNKHIEYSPETGAFTEISGFNKMHQQHETWYCQAGCINEDFALLFVTEDAESENAYYDRNLKVIDWEGNMLCEIEQAATLWTSPQILTIQNEKYLVICRPDLGEKRILELYKVSDLLQGKAEPQRIQRK